MRHHISLTGMLLGIEHLVRYSAQTQHTAQELGSLDIRRTHKHRASFLHKLNDLLDYSLILGLLCLVYQIIVVETGYRPVRRDYHNIQLVY